MEYEGKKCFDGRKTEYPAGGKQIVIRPMEERDVPAVSRLEETAFSMPWSPDAFLDMVKREDSLYVVATVGEEPIGCCGVTNACGDGDINNVVVDEAWRNKGVGKKMLEVLMEWGKETGIENYTLEVRVSNAPAIHLYEKLGFESAGIRPGFYDKPREDAVIMWKRQEEVG